MDFIEFFGPQGPLAKTHKFESRAEQGNLAQSIADAFEANQYIAVEAPTGIGKTLAYMFPSLGQARLENKPVVISTATLTLQEQILYKDAVQMKKVVKDLKITVLKGRSNYICPKMVKGVKLNLQVSALMVAEKYEYDMMPKEIQKHWDKYNATNCDDGSCKVCPIKMMREKAHSADLVIVNHALLAADRDCAIIPEPSAIIIDEAHRLIDVFTEAITKHISTECASIVDNIPGLSQDLLDEAYYIKEELGNLFIILNTIIGDLPPQDDMRIILPPNEDWKILMHCYNLFKNKLASYIIGINSISIVDEFQETRNAINLVKTLQESLTMFFESSDQDVVRWYDEEAKEILVAPLSVAETLSKRIWSRAPRGALVSATLSGYGKFDWDAYGLIKGPELILPSPFDYIKQCLLMLPDVPEPRSSQHPIDTAHAAMALARKFNGSTMVLCTSYRSLVSVSRYLKEVAVQYLPGITILAQGMDGTRPELINQFRQGQCILVGTTTFWEGIDLIGDQLRGLVIDKIPFDVPNDPIHSQRANKYAQPFLEYSLPRAAMRLKQGFGRLIRSTTDKGCVVITDSRMRTKPFGRILSAILPECTLLTGTITKLPMALTHFME